MKVLVINAGSSSLKYQLMDPDTNEVFAKGLCERIGIEGSKITHKANGGEWEQEVPFPTHTEAFMKVVEMMTSGEGAVVKDKSEISAIGHRVVQGAEFFTKSEIVTDAIIDKIEEIAPLAPVHNMAHVQGLRSAKAVFGEKVPNVVVFDTTFHQTMPKKAYMYGVPYEMYEKYSIRRYGAHGTSHRYVSMAAAQYLNDSDLKMVTCHLGNGSSISAVNAGKCVDTSMGLTPLAGVLMGTRCGDIDPSVVTYMEQKLGFHGQEMADYLNKNRPAGHFRRFQRYARCDERRRRGQRARQTGYRDACVSDQEICRFLRRRYGWAGLPGVYRRHRRERQPRARQRV